MKLRQRLALSTIFAGLVSLALAHPAVACAAKKVEGNPGVMLVILVAVIVFLACLV